PQRCKGECYWKANYPAGRGNFRAWARLSSARVLAGPTVGAVDGLITRGRTEYDRDFDRANGHSLRIGTEPKGRHCFGSVRVSGYGASNATTLDHLAASLDALVYRIVHQWRSYL